MWAIKAFTCASVASAALHVRTHQPEDAASIEAQQIADQVEQEVEGWKKPLGLTAKNGVLKKQAVVTNTDDQEAPQGPMRLKQVAPNILQKLPELPRIPVSMALAKKTSHKQPTVQSVKADAANAKQAASVARDAARVANKVAEHSVHITEHAKDALHHALSALHGARVDTKGLNKGQKESLKKAEGKLREATKTADYGKLKKLKDKSAADLKKDKMQDDMDARKHKIVKTETEREEMGREIKELRKDLKKKGGNAEEDKELKEMEGMVNEERKNGGGDAASDDELKAEISRLREQIAKMEAAEDKEGAVNYDTAKVKKVQHKLPKTDDEDEEEKEELMRDVNIKPMRSLGAGTKVRDLASEATPVEEKGIDIDTQMPYGDLEPFGREDTAQELTESSVRESDEMVDQLERAEVAEEKRAVFRALTRLRGAAITSFDGVARSQTGNIDEYNKIHKWRKTHPLHHLADEESDVTKWAFPDNAD